MPLPASRLPEWDDPRVQIVYNILCDPELNRPPDPEEHWEGWVARNIVAALSVCQQKTQQEMAMQELADQAQDLKMGYE